VTLAISPYLDQKAGTIISTPSNFDRFIIDNAVRTGIGAGLDLKSPTGFFSLQIQVLHRHTSVLAGSFSVVDNNVSHWKSPDERE
jgi:hypothetical protein